MNILVSIFPIYTRGKIFERDDDGVGKFFFVFSRVPLSLSVLTIKAVLLFSLSLIIVLCLCILFTPFLRKLSHKYLSLFAERVPYYYNTKVC